MFKILTLIVLQPAASVVEAVAAAVEEKLVITCDEANRIPTADNVPLSDDAKVAAAE
jgi:hypothetical protein